MVYEGYHGPLEWFEISNSNFEIKYKFGFIHDANKIINFANYARDIVLSNLPFEFGNVVDVYIYEGPTKINGTEIKWCEMRSDVNSMKIYLISPTNARQHSAGYDDVWYKANLVHEYVHHVIANRIRETSKRNMNEFLPRWFSEGIAGYIPYYHSSSEIMERYQSKIEEKIEMVLTGEGDFDTISEEVYFGGALLVKYMYDNFGELSVMNIISSNTNRWEDAIVEELVMTYSQFKHNLLIWVNENFR